jgi:hypothetical protein
MEWSDTFITTKCVFLLVEWLTSGFNWLPQPAARCHKNKREHSSNSFYGEWINKWLLGIKWVKLRSLPNFRSYDTVIVERLKTDMKSPTQTVCFPVAMREKRRAFQVTFVAVCITLTNTAFLAAFTFLLLLSQCWIRKISALVSQHSQPMCFHCLILWLILCFVKKNLNGRNRY